MKLKSDLGHQSAEHLTMFKKGVEMQIGRDDKFILHWRKQDLGGA